MKKRPEESVHVRLEMPLDKRKTVLQAAIDTMQLMKRHENIVRIRQEKEQVYVEFRKVLATINRMVREVRMKELPLDSDDIKHVKKVKNISIMAPVVKKVEKVLKTKGKRPEPEKKSSSLNSQIDSLQRKMQNL